MTENAAPAAHPITATVEFEPADQWSPAGWKVTATTTGLDRADVLGWVVTNRSVADRLAAAVNAGAVFTDAEVRTDVNGQTYLSATTRVHARRANADLRRIGF
jgi:hypothetical protein